MRGSGFSSLLMITKTRPVIGRACADAGNDMWIVTWGVAGAAAARIPKNAPAAITPAATMRASVFIQRL
jgi:hypothetical protein